MERIRRICRKVKSVRPAIGRHKGVTELCVSRRCMENVVRRRTKEKIVTGSGSDDRGYRICRC